MANNITFIAVVGSALVTELIQLTFTNKDNLYLITGAVIVFTIVGLNIYNYLYEKRVSKGTGPQSIAIKSSKLVSDYLKYLKNLVKQDKYREKETIVLKEIRSISRPLLLLGEYKVRYLIGKLVSENTDKTEIKMRFMMDEMGWTSVLMGKKRAVKEISEAIDLFPVTFNKYNKSISLNIGDTEDSDLHKLFLVARGKRHLASTQFLDPEKRFKISLEASAIMSYLDDVSYIDNVISKDKRNSMVAGIYYGMGEIKYEMATKLQKQESTALDFYETLTESYKYTELTARISKGFSNKHRYLKALLLKNSIINLMLSINNQTDFKDSVKDMEYGVELSSNTTKNVQENIDYIEKLLNSSIYVDEAFEVYLKQRIKF
ncbi:MAG: hypothetical protein ACQESM_09705 [Bacteroidota bacterium]